MREILLDTETTGLSHAQGHRVIEIGCVEMVNRSLTGKTYHTYINPERDVPPDASRISGLTTEFLKPFPLFEHIADEFLDFIQDSTLVIHNAPFDIGFLNAELKILSKTQLNLALAVDTVKMARKQFPGSPANLDALCRRFNVDLTSRTKHGALVDAHLLAKVYIHLTGGRQRKLFDGDAANTETGMRRAHAADSSFSTGGNAVRAPRPFPESEEERLAHSNFLESIKDPLWNKIS